MDISAINYDKILALKPHIKIAAIISMAFIIYLLGYFVLLGSRYQRISGLEQQEITLKDSYGALTDTKIKYLSNKEKLLELKHKYAVFKKQLPKEPNIASILNNISTSASNNDLSILEVKPEKKVKANYVIIQPITLKLQGNYDEFGHFIAELANFETIASIQYFSIKKNILPDNDVGEFKADVTFLTMEMTILVREYTGVKLIEKHK